MSTFDVVLMVVIGCLLVVVCWQWAVIRRWEVVAGNWRYAAEVASERWQTAAEGWERAAGGRE